MVEVYERHVHFLGSSAEVIMVESTHFSTFIFASFPKKLFLSKFESPPIKKFLILIRSLLDFSTSCVHLFKDLPLFLRQLLQLDIVQLIIIEKFAENYIEVWSILMWFRLDLGRQFRWRGLY